MKTERCAELLTELLAQKLARNDSIVTAAEITAWLRSSDEERGKGRGACSAAISTATTPAPGTSVSTSNSAVGRSTAIDMPIDSSARGARTDVNQVFNHWQHTYEKRSNEPLTARRYDALVKVLDYGISVARCCALLDQVRDDPALLKRRTPRPDLYTVFKSLKRVCQLLGVEYKPLVDTWLTPFDLVWQQHYGAAIPFGVAGKALHPLVKHHGALEVQRRLDNYCASTEAAYVSLPKFAATFGAWTTKKSSNGFRQKPGADMAPDWPG